MTQQEIATVGGGCFWCTEAVFQNVRGVLKVESGYAGGETTNPSYEEVCSGDTGHAEVVQITFDPDQISYKDILEIFWKTHDPTTLNRQGNDVGTQYRSVVFYHNEEQRKVAESLRTSLDKEGIWDSPIVTEIASFKNYFRAEGYHQNYYSAHEQQPYCSYVIAPKLGKFRKTFKERLKTNK